VTAKIPTTP